MIRFDNVTKTYQPGVDPALNGVTLDIEKGEFIFLIGASGSGKSTLMRLVLKETVPTRGHVYVAGRDLSRIPTRRVPELRRQIGMVFQDFRLLPSKTVYQNIEFALQVIGASRRKVKTMVPEMIELVGLQGKGKRYPHELSGGEQQRVAVARAYVNRPSILLADEPTGNLDPVTSVEIMKLLSEINERGTTVVMATHDRSLVDAEQRRVVELIGGNIVRDQENAFYSPLGPGRSETSEIPVVRVDEAQQENTFSEAPVVALPSAPEKPRARFKPAAERIRRGERFDSDSAFAQDDEFGDAR
ncbi:cell division ATP-binding protein FtsE [Dermabacteraceae bacterium P13077]